MKRLVSLAILLILISFPAIAQVTQTGTLDGTVYDQEKQPLPGVTVSIKSPALILPVNGDGDHRTWSISISSASTGNL